MKPTLGGRVFKPALGAALLALSASVAVAEGFDDADPAKDAVCAAMGCNNGSRVCGTATRAGWAWITVYWDLSILVPDAVTFTCYEQLPF